MTLPTIDAQVLTAAGTLALAVTSAAGTYLARLLRKHASVAEITMAQRIFATAVAAAEQMGVGKLTGNAKFQLAERNALADLAKYGITLTPDQVRNGIEAEVQQLKQFGGTLTAPAGTPAPVDPSLPTPAQATAAALRAAADQIDGASAPTTAPVVAPTVQPAS